MNFIQKIEEKKYKKELREFQYKNPTATEENYIRYRIRVIERYLPECEETADFIKGELMDGLEILDGVPTTTKLGTASDYLYLDKEMQDLKNRLQRLSEPKQPEPKVTVKEVEGQNWFKVGLLFATGEIYPLLTKYQNNSTQLAAELGNEKGYRPFISDSVGDSADRPTNIFSRPKKIKALHKYCTENQIPMCNDFIEKYNQIKPE